MSDNAPPDSGNTDKKLVASDAKTTSSKADPLRPTVWYAFSHLGIGDKAKVDGHEALVTDKSLYSLKVQWRSEGVIRSGWFKLWDAKMHGLDPKDDRTPTLSE